MSNAENNIEVGSQVRFTGFTGDPADNADLLEEGEVYEIHLDLHATSNYFDKGHRVRLEVSSSNFPRWSRNLNTGGNNYDETEGIPATNTVHHSTEYPSHVVLPVVMRDQISSISAEK